MVYLLRWAGTCYVLKQVQKSFICTACHFKLEEFSIYLTAFAICIWVFSFPPVILLGTLHNKSLNLIKKNSTCGTARGSIGI